MKQKLIPIIAAYWGCECSYQTIGILLTPKIDWPELKHINTNINFKIQLRPLWSITEDELLEIGKISDVERVTVNIVLGGNDAHKSVLEGSYSYGEPVFKVDNENNMTIKSYYPAKIINYLRSKSFCVDQELIDNDLVQWV